MSYEETDVDVNKVYSLSDQVGPRKDDLFLALGGGRVLRATVDYNRSGWMIVRLKESCK